MDRLTLDQAFQIGIRHHQAGQISQAEQIYRAILAQQPNHPDALHHLGVIAHQADRNDIAEDLIRRAIAFKPNFPEAYNNLGAVLKANGRLDDAIAAYQQAIVLYPAYPVAHGNLVYSLHFHPRQDARTIAEERRRWNRRHAEPLRRFIGPYPNDPNPNRRLRIGYISPDFRQHVIGRNLLPLFHHHDREQFEITCYAQVLVPDAATEQFQRLADRWHNIIGQSDQAVAELVRQDRIDILVDSSLHLADNRLLVFARKPAPVQVTFAGYPGSTGLSAIDYRLSDPYLDPPNMDESIYSEKTIRLPDSFWCYDPLDCRDIPVNALPSATSGITTFGCLNSLSKINDDVLLLWAQVLRQVVNSRLLLLCLQGSHRQRTTDILSHQGIEPGRLEFLEPRPRRQYLELYHRIDLGLDTFPYNGHTTSLDSYWMGVPVSTLVGKTAVSRAGWCHLSNLNLRELAAHSSEQFVKIAVDLASDIPRLNNFRSILRQRMEQSPLMNVLSFSRNIEAAYCQMWRNWCASHVSIDV